MVFLVIIDQNKLRQLRLERDEAKQLKSNAKKQLKEELKQFKELANSYNNVLRKKEKRISNEIERNSKKADEEHRLMHECFEKAPNAYSEGEKAKAKELSDEGYTHQYNRNQLNKKVQELISEKRKLATYKLPYNEADLLSVNFSQKPNVDNNLILKLIFSKALIDTYQENYNRYSERYEKKRNIYENYKKYGDDPALNSMKETSDTWSPYIRGWIGEQAVTVRKGKVGTENEGHTLISDGHVSSKFFKGHNPDHQGHNHYGPNKHSNIFFKRIEDVGGDRGKYTGPGH